MIILHLAPYLLSTLTAYCFLSLLLRKASLISRPAKIFLSAGLGLGCSAILVYTSFLLFHQLNRPFTVFCQTGMLIFLLIFQHFTFQAEKPDQPPARIKRSTLLYIPLFLFIVPLWVEAKFWPYGGWDAWQVWNFKSRFLFLAGENWTHLFLPSLWRTSPHYPLLLPLVNVWGWIFSKEPGTLGPMLTAVIFTCLTCGLLYAGLRQMTKNDFSIMAPLILISSPFIATLAVSQYCDIVLGYYLLATFYCMVLALQTAERRIGFLAGAFCGLLAFTKPEGTVAAFLMAGLFPVCLFLPGLVLPGYEHRKDSPKTDFSHLLLKKSLFQSFLTGLIPFLVPTFVFLFLNSPGNQTFINGLTSSPASSPLRFRYILAFFWATVTSPKWNGLWLLILTGLLFHLKKSVRPAWRIIPLFLLFYLLAITAVYWINTRFDITWWLSVTLDRILFSLLPAILFWIFLSVFFPTEKPKKGFEQSSQPD